MLIMIALMTFVVLFGQIPSDRTISPEVVGITDPLTVQVKVAAFQVGKGEISIDEAVKNYGSFK